MERSRGKWAADSMCVAGVGAQRECKGDTLGKRWVAREEASPAPLPHSLVASPLQLEPAVAVGPIHVLRQRFGLPSRK